MKLPSCGYDDIIQALDGTYQCQMCGKLMDEQWVWFMKDAVKRKLLVKPSTANLKLRARA